MYMTIAEIRALSRRIPAIVDATDEEISFWAEDATDVIHSYCMQDFTYERQGTRTVTARSGSPVYLPTVISGDVQIVEGGSTVFTASGTSLGTTPALYVNECYCKWDYPLNFISGNSSFSYGSPSSSGGTTTLSVTGDWGYYPTEEGLLFDGINALRDLYESHRASAVYHNSPDTLNAIVSPSAIDLDTAAVLLNELKGVINSHFGDFVAHNVEDPNVSTLPDVTDQNSAKALLADLKARFNAHLAKGGDNLSVHDEIDSENVATFSVDFAGGVLPRAIRRVFLRLVQRIALRDDPEDHRQMNSVYTNETLGDGYNYDLSNGTLRNLMRPEEALMLLPYINRGPVVV